MISSMDAVYFVVEALVAFAEREPSSFFVTLALLAVLSIPVTLLHETGHAVVARMTLETDVEVRVGDVGKLAELQLGEIRFHVNVASTFSGPAGHAAFDDSRARARDIIVIALAGPAASLIGTVVTALICNASSPGTALHDVFWAATVVGAWGVVINLIPMELAQRRGERWRTDGRLALDAFRTLRAVPT